MSMIFQIRFFIENKKEKLIEYAQIWYKLTINDFFGNVLMVLFYTYLMFILFCFISVAMLKADNC